MVKAFQFKIYRKPKVARLHRLVNLHGMLHNHCIALHKKYYKLTGKHLNQFALMKHVTKLKTRNGFEWIGLMGSQSVQDAIQRIEKGYTLFFSERKKGNTKIRPPGFKKISKARSFTLKQAGWKLVRDNIIRVDGVTFKFALSRPIEGKIKTVTIRRDTVGDFWVVFACEIENSDKQSLPMTGETAGLDFGLKTFLTVSDGTEVVSPQFFKQGSREVAKANRTLSRAKKGSKNRSKAVKALARTHRTIAHKRADWQWKEGRKLATRFDTVWIEDLNLAGMKALWGRKVSDLSFYSFTLKLKYLFESNGKEFGKRDRFLASSKTHHACGWKNDALTLNDRLWLCDCGEWVERDLNAALMIKDGRASSSSVEVCKPGLVPAALFDAQESPRL